MKAKNIEEMRKTVTDKLQNTFETTVQVMSVTKLRNMFRVKKMGSAVIVQKL
jgi:hypothetical protein